MATASQIRLRPRLGVARATDTNPDGALEAANRLLQKNHNEHHMFWRSVAGHNHVAHSVLNTLALGGGPGDLQRAFDDGAEIQVPIPPMDRDAAASLSTPDQFRARMGSLEQYPNFLVFFTKEIETRGYPAVVIEYCFSGTSIAESMFANLFEGLYHPLIHLALGIEFDQPSIVAEGLAQAACHDSMNIEPFLFGTDKLAKTQDAPIDLNTSLLSLFHAVRDNEVLRAAAHRDHGDGVARVRDGILGRAREEISLIAARFRVDVDELDHRAAEMISCAAYLAGSAQRPGKARKIDFFHLHAVTASLGLIVLLQQPWVTPEQKARLIEWKARVDLVWYAASGAVELRRKDIVDYRPRHGLTWDSLYQAVRRVHDDGHLAKFIRALKAGEQISRPFEQGKRAEAFPIKGSMWLRIAQMAYDSSAGRPIEEKWIWGAGFEPNWATVPAV
ncbi:hypothetical protein KXX25_008446 [Aspergillus fumigatus]|nr:hypothetical protein KXX28_008845 [Aspergillus fumigatus]KAH1599199.1 hypothetical protein KXX34_007468 [Aspergillus fumigatus]KAH1646452.1 hypothetical protein KXX59_007794 [Aspergillus fumigatus]KAH1703423.1 hypothetical protein KXX23_007190 [Aspergillus fumigatus]KAH1727826.1 hypothetical protein KXX25_008446 [Aspergillus fumigatus]